MRCVPLPVIGVTGVSRASLTNVGRMPPLAAEDEARPEDDVVDPGALHLLLLLPFGVVVGDEVLRLLVEAQRAHEHEAAHTGLLRRRYEIARALLHHALEQLARALAYGNEVDDALLPLDRPPQALGGGHVALDDLRARRLQLPYVRVLRLAGEQPQVVTVLHQRPHDRRTDEAGAAGDEELQRRTASSTKFFQ